jgi:hypothetical protein
MKLKPTILGVVALFLFLTLPSGLAAGKPKPQPPSPTEPDCALLERTIQPGDLVFIRIGSRVFQELEILQDAWATHVGIVVEDFFGNPVVAESRIPKSVKGPICDFIKRSKEYRFAIRRLNQPLTPTEKTLLSLEAERRLGLWYDLGFNYASETTQYCSKFVYQTMKSATGLRAGMLQTFEELKDAASKQGKDIGAILKFWKNYFGGKIPWKRVTITPASQYHDPNYHTVLESQ